MELFLYGVSDAHGSKIDRPAIWTACGAHGLLSFIHTSRGSSVSLDSAPASGSLMVSERGEGVMYVGSAAAAGGPACFPGSLNLFRRSQVGLRESDLVLRPRNLALVPLL